MVIVITGVSGTGKSSEGKRGSAAKKAGEGAIIADLARVMVALSPAQRRDAGCPGRD